MKYFLHSVIFLYYVALLDNVLNGIGGGYFSTMLSTPFDYITAFLYEIWLILLFLLFVHLVKGDKWLTRGLMFYWIPAFILLFVVVN